MLKKLKVLLFLCVICASMTSISAASELMAWSGTGIVGKASLQSFYGQGQSVTIYNNIYNAYNVNVVHQYGLGEQTWYYSTGKGSQYDMYFADAYGDTSTYYNPMDMTGYVK